MPVTAIKGPYIPRADSAFREWLDNFSTVIARAPWAVGLAPSDAARLTALAQRYAEAYVRARAPGTRNCSTVRRKNLLRREAWDTVRAIAMRIKRDRGVSDAQKIELGVYPPLGGQSPIPKPRTAPLLELIEMRPGVHRLRYQDRSRPSRFAKPYGAVSLQLLIQVARKAAASPDGAHRVQHATRHVFDVKFAAAESGRTATYFARWVTRRGRTGPWSRPLAVTIV